MKYITTNWETWHFIGKYGMPRCGAQTVYQWMPWEGLDDDLEGTICRNCLKGNRESPMGDRPIELDNPEMMGWWVINGAMLLDALRQCYRGENPDMVYAELYANSKVEQPDE